MKRIFPLIACMLAAHTASASDLDLHVRSGGSHHIWVQTGQSVTYEVEGELTDNLNQGLAFFAFNLQFDGGDLGQAQAPSSANMLNFATPLGLNNPAGFGGTVHNGDLIQIGGGQNTIIQSFAAAPSGLVMTGIATLGAPELLVTGILTSPMTAGTYHLTPSDLHANVIDANASGSPFWTVSSAGTGVMHGLVLHVSDCAPPNNYCAGKANSAGCTATLSATGTATLTGPNDFVIHANDVINKRFGLMFWGTGATNLPWAGGTLCVAPPLIRMGAHFTGGAGPTGSNCNGQIHQLFSQVLMVNRGLMAGDTVAIQCWYRDPPHADGTGVAMTDALTFTICP